MTQIKVNIILRNGGNVLVLKRSKKDGGFWQTITGTIEKDENLLDAARREIKEETSIKDIKSEFGPIHYFTWKKGKDDVIEVVFLFYTDKRKVILSEEHTKYKWLSASEAVEIVKTENNKLSILKAF